MSEVTKNYNKKRYIFFWLGVLLSFLPVIIFGIIGCMNGKINISSKLYLGVSFATAILLLVMGVKSKYNCRSITYIFLFGCYFVIKDVKWVILVTGLCCILDEFVCMPLHKIYKEKAIVNKEIDKRME